MYYKLQLDQYNTVDLAFAALPMDTTAIDLSEHNDNAQRCKSPAKWIEILKKIPADVTSLNLSSNAFYLFSAWDIYKIFQAIPESVISLDLSFNDLGRASLAADLNMTRRIRRDCFTFAIVGIPLSVTSLCLKGNDLNQILANESDVFQGLSTNLTSLDLSDNDLYKKPTAELIQLLRSIPASVTSLNISRNGLGRLDDGELIEIFRAIHQSVLSLDLSGNYFFPHNIEPSIAAFAEIPASVTSLNLSGICKIPVNHLLELFAAIPNRVTTLNLRCNGFGSNDSSDLHTILVAIPRNVTSLNLGSNNLNEQNAVGLSLALAAIPDHVTSLDLSENILGRKSTEELVAIFKAIPASVTVLDLGNNGLGDKRERALAYALKQIRKSRDNPPCSKMVILKNNQLFTNKTWAQKDRTLITLRLSESEGCKLDLSGNGRSDAQDAIVFLVGLAKQKPRISEVMLFVCILSYLLPDKFLLLRCAEQRFSNALKFIEAKPRVVHDNQRVEQSASSSSSDPHTFFRGHQHGSQVDASFSDSEQDSMRI